MKINTDEIKITMSNGALTYEITLQKFAINVNTKEQLLEQIKEHLEEIIGDDKQMELWIRTQNRENTVKIINGYGLKYNDKKTIIANYQPDFTDRYDRYYELLGTYETKERALEVLDEIQDLLQNAYVGGSNRIVYQMPKDE